MFNSKKKNFKINEEKIIRDSFNNSPDIKINKNQPTEEREPLEIKADINKYHDPEGLTVNKMNIGLWFLEHKKQLIALPTIILIAFSVFCWSYVLYGLGYYFIKGMSDDRLLADKISERNLVGHDYFVKIAPKKLAIYETQIFKLDNGKYDFMAIVKNLNKNHIGRFKYSFLGDDYETEEETEFILPGETKYLLVLRIKGMSWIRLDKHDYPDWDNFYKEHMAITASDIKFTPAKSTILTEKINLNELSFSMENNTAYNYRSVGAIILLKLADRIIAVNKYTVSDLMSGEKRSVDITWPGRLGRVDDILVIPELDIVRDDIYIGFKGEINNESF